MIDSIVEREESSVPVRTFGHLRLIECPNVHTGTKVQERFLISIQSSQARRFAIPSKISGSVCFAVLGCLVLMSGCESCGEGLPCGWQPTPQSSSFTPSIELNGDGVPVFNMPSGVDKRRQYGLLYLEVYDAINGERLWKVVDEPNSGLIIANMPPIDAHLPITYGQTFPKSVVSVAARKLQIGITYRMQAQLTYVTPRYITEGDIIKVDFEIEQGENGLRVKALRSPQ